MRDAGRRRTPTRRSPTRAPAARRYVLNLIDTPGHVDFAYEVSRSLQACEGALLVVDASQGVQAQTIANVFLAIEQNLEILPVLNKIDLPGADPDRVAEEVETVIGLDCSEVRAACAGEGTEKVSTWRPDVTHSLPCDTLAFSPRRSRARPRWDSASRRFSSRLSRRCAAIHRLFTGCSRAAHTTAVHTSPVHTTAVNTTAVCTSAVHTTAVFINAVHATIVHTAAVHTTTFVHTIKTVHTTTAVHTNAVHTKAVHTTPADHTATAFHTPHLQRADAVAGLWLARVDGRKTR